MKGSRVPALILVILCVLILFPGCSDSAGTKRQASRTPVPMTSAAARTTESRPLPTAALTEATTTAAIADFPTEAAAEAAAETEALIGAETAELPAAASAPEQPATEAAAPEEAPVRSAPTTEPQKTEPAEKASEEPELKVTEPNETEPKVTYVANTNTKKFHVPSCSSVTDMKESNKWYFTGAREELIAQGYEPCKRCKP